MRIVAAPSTFATVVAIAGVGGTDAFSTTTTAFPSTSRRSSRGHGRVVGGRGIPLQMASDRPLTELCEITREACEAVAPMLNGEGGGV